MADEKSKISHFSNGIFFHGKRCVSMKKKPVGCGPALSYYYYYPLQPHAHTLTHSLKPRSNRRNKNWNWREETKKKKNGKNSCAKILTAAVVCLVAPHYEIFSLVPHTRARGNMDILHNWIEIFHLPLIRATFTNSFSSSILIGGMCSSRTPNWIFRSICLFLLFFFWIFFLSFLKFKKQ